MGLHSAALNCGHSKQTRANCSVFRSGFNPQGPVSRQKLSSETDFKHARDKLHLSKW